MADNNSSISSPSLDYCGVQTPESSPHGSPLAGNEPISIRSNSNSADLYRYTNSPRAFYGQTQYAVAGTSSPNMAEMQGKKNNHLEYVGKGQSNLRDTLKSLPTPEMSPVEANEKDVAACQQYQNYGLHAGHQMKMSGQGTEQMHSQMYGGGSAFQQYGQYNQKSPLGKSHPGEHLSPPPSQVKTENPFSELVSRFSGTSTFLRNVCPPYSYRMQSRESIEEMHRASNYLKQVDPQFDQSPRSMLQHQLEMQTNADGRSYRAWPNATMPDNGVMYDLDRANAYHMYGKATDHRVAPSELGYPGPNNAPYHNHDGALYYGHMMPDGANFADPYSSHPYGNSVGLMGSMTHGDLTMSMMNSGTGAGPALVNFEHGDPRHDSPGGNHTCDSSNSELIAALAETREIIS